MKSNNRITKLLRVLIHIWWYLTIVGAAILSIMLIGSEAGAWDRIGSMDLGIEWKIEDIKAENELSLTVTDKNGRQYLLDFLEGKGSLEFELSEGMGKLAIPFFVIFFPGLGMGLWAIFQLRKLFDNLARGNYFEEINAIRIRRIAYAAFSFVALRLIVQILFESIFTIQTGSHISVSGIEIGISPLFLSALFLLTLSEVFKEAAILKTEQDLTV